MSITIKAYGKLNLSLNIEGMLDARYHRLSSVLTTVNVYDTVIVEKRTDNLVSLTIDGEVTTLNPAFSIATAIVRDYHIGGINIDVKKGVTGRAGMGGSSVAASATINAISKLYSIPINSHLLKLASLHGSDIVYLITGGLALASGKGDDVQFVKCENVFYFTIINGQSLTSTDVFAQYDITPDKTRYDNDKLLSLLTQNSIEEARHYLGNNLQCAAVRVAPSLRSIITTCARLGLPTPTMTGSGGNFFILCQSQEEAQNFANTLNANGVAAYATYSVNNGCQLID